MSNERYLREILSAISVEDLLAIPSVRETLEEEFLGEIEELKYQEELEQAIQNKIDIMRGKE